MKKKILFLGAIITSIIIGCQSDPEILVNQPIVFQIPEGWPTPHYQFENNTLTQAGFELGRKLFYDPRLSRDNSVSCGSCHQQFSAFAQLDHAVSHGVDNLEGNRNSPALFNLAWHNSFFWDGGVNHIEVQPIAPIQNPVEMDEKLANIIPKLQADADYQIRFTKAFGNDTINSQRMLKALAQFMAALVSKDSKYDRVMRKESGYSFTTSEQNGMQIFEQKCSTCHKAPLFSDFTYRNNGLTASAVNDSGRAHITKDAADLYKFKVPSLRNLKYTAPYMHDGRFKNLENVLQHYVSGITNSTTLDASLQGGISLTDQQKTDLLAFLNTLNDEVFTKNKQFAEVK